MSEKNETYLQHFGNFYAKFIGQDYPVELEDFSRKVMLVSGSIETSRESTPDYKKTTYETYMSLDKEKDIGVRIVHSYKQKENVREFPFGRNEYSVDSCTIINNYSENTKDKNLAINDNALWSLGAGQLEAIKFFSEVSPAINNVVEDLQQKTDNFSTVPTLLIIDDFPVSSSLATRFSFSDASEMLAEALDGKFENILILNQENKDFYFQGNPEVVKMISDDKSIFKLDENTFFRNDCYGSPSFSIEDSVLNAVSSVYAREVEGNEFTLVDTGIEERQIVEDLEK